MIEQAVRQVAKGRGGVDVDQVRQGRHLLFRGRGVGQVLEGPFRPRRQGQEGVIRQRRQGREEGELQRRERQGEQIGQGRRDVNGFVREGGGRQGGRRRAAHHGEVLEVSQHARGQER